MKPILTDIAIGVLTGLLISAALLGAYFTLYSLRWLLWAAIHCIGP